MFWLHFCEYIVAMAMILFFHLLLEVCYMCLSSYLNGLNMQISVKAVKAVYICVCVCVTL